MVTSRGLNIILELGRGYNFQIIRTKEIFIYIAKEALDVPFATAITHQTMSPKTVALRFPDNDRIWFSSPEQVANPSFQR